MKKRLELLVKKHIKGKLKKDFIVKKEEDSYIIISNGKITKLTKIELEYLVAELKNYMVDKREISQNNAFTVSNDEGNNVLTYQDMTYIYTDRQLKRFVKQLKACE